MLYCLSILNGVHDRVLQLLSAAKKGLKEVLLNAHKDLNAQKSNAGFSKKQPNLTNLTTNHGQTT